MSIVLFAIIGAHINVGAGYWICYGLFCALKLCIALYNAYKKGKETLKNSKE